jgi:hypothetical protein
MIAEAAQVVVGLSLSIAVLAQIAVLAGALYFARPPATPCPPGTWRFPLAPMDGLNLGSTIVVGLMVGPMPLVSLVLTWVWLHDRPTCFELSPAGLDIIWPLRRERIPLATLSGVERLSRREVNARYGFGLRFGSGGFGGGFGQLITPRQRFRMYVSRLDEHVLIHARQGLPLLLTPADAQGFMQCLAQLAAWGER